jgi:hypothetical protein
MQQMIIKFDFNSTQRWTEGGICLNRSRKDSNIFRLPYLWQMLYTENTGTSLKNQVPINR